MRRLVIQAVLMAIAVAGCGEPMKPTPPTGSCCTPYGSCTVTAAAQCIDGAWTVGFMCVPNTCAKPTGACCRLGGSCTVILAADCAGPWSMFGVCDPNPCPLSPIDMVSIPAGTFTMGSPVSEPGRDSGEAQHQVTLTKAIFVSVHEVTQSEWRRVMGKSQPGFTGDNRPMEMVDWNGCIVYCNKRSAMEGPDSVYARSGSTWSWDQSKTGYRLLTESEWEYACRATSTTAFCNGGITNINCSPLDPNLDRVGWYCGNAWSGTPDVGSKDANTWGLHDMHGSVFEWCWDWYADYPGHPVTDPTGPALGTSRVIRGGSWYWDAWYCRSAFRSGASPGYLSPGLGFRLARTAP